MKRKISVVTILISLVVMPIFSCKKEKDPTYCWQLLDNSGNQTQVVCDKTSSEMQSLYGACSYYKAGGELHCWLINGNIFIKDATENFINFYLQCHENTHAEKVACDYCQKWYTRQKNLYKPDNSFSYSPIRVQQLCGDTVSRLFQGREIIIRESADSLISLQFSNNGTF